MKVRAAVAGDLGWILQVERASETAPHWGEAEYQKILAGEGVARCLLVAEGGFAVGKIVAGGGELESVVVDAGARRRGVGRALCEAVVEWCGSLGAREVELEVRVGSVGARKLYEGLGFVEVGRRVRYYDGPVEDAVLMRLELA